jgi:hypothetical protein
MPAVRQAKFAMSERTAGSSLFDSAVSPRAGRRLIDAATISRAGRGGEHDPEAQVEKWREAVTS